MERVTGGHVQNFRQGIDRAQTYLHEHKAAALRSVAAVGLLAQTVVMSACGDVPFFQSADAGRPDPIELMTPNIEPTKSPVATRTPRATATMDDYMKKRLGIPTSVAIGPTATPDLRPAQWNDTPKQKEEVPAPRSTPTQTGMLSTAEYNPANFNGYHDTDLNAGLMSLSRHQYEFLTDYGTDNLNDSATDKNLEVQNLAKNLITILDNSGSITQKSTDAVGHTTAITKYVVLTTNTGDKIIVKAQMFKPQDMGSIYLDKKGAANTNIANINLSANLISGSQISEFSYFGQVDLLNNSRQVINTRSASTIKPIPAENSSIDAIYKYWKEELENDGSNHVSKQQIDYNLIHELAPLLSSANIDIDNGQQLTTQIPA